MFQRWGPVFLSADEYDRKLFVRLLGYGTFLSRNAFRLRHREFREYHAARAREILERTRPGGVAHGAALQLAKTLGSGTR
jgi:hypothetical protein